MPSPVYRSHFRRSVSAVASWLPAILTLIATALAQGTIGPPIKITVEREGLVPAVAAQESQGVIAVRVGGTGRLDGFRLEGTGWTVAALETPSELLVQAGDVVRIRFRATPGNPSEPLIFHVAHNGRTVEKQFSLHQDVFDRAGRARALQRLPEAITPLPSGDAPEGGSCSDQQIHFSGRVVYLRPATAVDIPNYPGGNTIVVGVDNVRVEIRDEDDVALEDEVMWSGLTDQNGYFDVTICWDDCDILGCDDPDIYLYVETDTDVVSVQEGGILEEDYSWSTEDTPLEIDDFSGNEVNFGTLMPADATLSPALHIHNSIVRAHRFILTRSGADTGHVDAQWPEGASGASYNCFFEDMYVGVDRQWKEDTQTHEYGHHYACEFSDINDPDYCNGFCDDTMICGSPGNCPSPGHCQWCPENDEDAWAEGWPNWFADVVTRSYPLDYVDSSGAPYQPLFTRSQEPNSGACCAQTWGAVITEGFVGALLRDMEDAAEDANGDGLPDVQPACARDALALGVDEIFTVLDLDEPETVLEFINAFRARFPQFSTGLWKTANSIGGSAYTWPDSALPGAVTVLSSPSHPLGVGGGSPLITVTWEEAPDDASGADVYAVGWSTTALGPPFFTATVSGPDPATGQFTTVSPPLGIGQYWFLIRAQDCVGNWSEALAFFGPFEVTDCNGNGLVDTCEATCDLCATLPAGATCTSDIQNFCNITGCGGAADCNGNFSPDACDVVTGASGDCNDNGTPDECEAVTFVQWVGASGSWHDPANWSPGLPGTGSHACIDVADDITVTYSLGSTQIASLGCYETFSLTGGTLAGTENFGFFGPLALSGGTLSGTGTTHANGDVTISNFATNKDLARNFINNGTAAWTGGTLGISAGAMFTNAPGRLFDDQQGANVNGSGQLLDHNITWLSGTPAGIFNNAGSFRKSSGVGTTNVSFVPFNNSGTVEVLAGTFSLNGGGTSTGTFNGSSGATLRFGGGTHSLTSTSAINAATMAFTSGTVNIDGTYQASDTTNISASVTFNPAATLVSVGNLLNVMTNANATFNSGEPVTVPDYTQSGGTFTGSSDLTVAGSLSFSAGTMAGSGTTHANGSATISNFNTSKDIARNFVSNGTATWTGGTLGISAGATFTNALSHLFDDQQGANVNGTGQAVDNSITWISGAQAGAFNNAGTFRKSSGTGSTSVGFVPFNNSGMVEVLAGTLSLNGGGTSTGTFNGSAGSTLRFGGGTHNLTNTSAITAATVGFTSGTVNIDGTYQASDTTNISASVTLNPAATLLSVGNLLNLMSGASATFNSGEPVTVPDYTQSGGTFTGSSDLTVAGSLGFSGGTMAGSGTTLANGNVTITNYNTSKDIARNFINNGATAWVSGTVGVSAGATFTNAVGHLFDDQQGANINPSSGLAVDNNITWISGAQAGVFNNAGTFRKSTGTGTTSVGFVPFNNSGMVEVLAGTLSLNGGGTSTGTFNGSAGATLRFGGGTHTLTNTSAIHAATVAFTAGTANIDGSFQVSDTTNISASVTLNPAATLASVGNLLNLLSGASATFNSGEPVTVPDYTQSGGTFTGSSDLTVAGSLAFSGGTMAGSGTTQANGNVTITNYNTNKDIARNFVNNGTTTWVSGTLGLSAGATFTNAAGHLFDDQQGANINPSSGLAVDNSITWISGAQTGVFNNAGTFRKSSGTGTTNVNFVPFNNTGTIEILSGTLSFGSGSSTAGLYQTAGETILNGGNLQSTNPIALQGGFLRGNGTVTGSVTNSAGTVAPGFSPGTLTITGNYINSGALSIELGGTTPGTGFDVVNVGGTATLSGSLQIALINGFNPPVGSTYQILTAGTRNGTFTNVVAPPGLQVNVIYAANSVTLEISGTPTPVDILAANPPLTNPYGSGVFRDVLQNTTAALAPQGIGVPGTPDQGPYTYAAMQVTFSGTPTPAPNASNVNVSCTDVAGNGAGDCPGIASVGGVGAGPWMIELTAPPPARECITLNFAGTHAGQHLQYQALPGDTNLDGNVNTQDLLWLVQRINDGLANQAANLARYNVNRSTGTSPVNTQDLLRLVQLLNGVNATQAFNGATVAGCP